jgi:hypothetical protein
MNTVRCDRRQLTLDGMLEGSSPMIPQNLTPQHRSAVGGCGQRSIRLNQRSGLAPLFRPSRLKTEPVFRDTESPLRERRHASIVDVAIWRPCDLGNVAFNDDSRTISKYHEWFYLNIRRSLHPQKQRGKRELKRLGQWPCNRKYSKYRNPQETTQPLENQESISTVSAHVHILSAV